MAAGRLPSKPDAEAAVIGGILFCGRALTHVADVVDAEDFHDAKHEAIFAACLALDRAQRPIDIVTVAEELRRAGSMKWLVAAGSEAYLAELATRVGTVDNIAEHARIVREKATARRLILAAQAIIAEGYADTLPTELLVERAQNSVFAVQQRSTKKSFRPMGDITFESVQDLRARAERKQKVTGVPTGFGELDDITNGLQRSELVIIAGRPSMGKTALAMNVAVNAARLGFPSLVFSAEMRDRALVDRILCGEARVNSHGYRSGFLSPHDWKSLLHEAGRVAELPICIDDSGSPTLTEIRAKARRWRSMSRYFPPGEAEPLGLVVIDYLQLVQGTQRGREQNREREIAEISRGLKALAKELGLPVVALSQLNRGVESRTDKRPMMSDLRESGAIEQDADLIAFVYRDEFYYPDSDDKGIAEVLIRKQRNGRTGDIKLAFLGEYTQFEPLSNREAA